MIYNTEDQFTADILNIQEGAIYADESQFDIDNDLETIDTNKTIDDRKISCSSKIYINTRAFKKRLFGSHYNVIEVKKKSKPGIVRKVEQIKYINEYITKETIEKYKNIGLYCHSYLLTFKVNNEEANNQMRDNFDIRCYKEKTGTFEFKQKYKPETFDADYIEEVRNNIAAFLNIASQFCNAEEIEINVTFIYEISTALLREKKYDEIRKYLTTREVDYILDTETSELEVKYDWRSQNRIELLMELETNIPFVKVS